MTKQIHEKKLGDPYQRMFRFDGLRMAHIDIFMHYYSQLNVVQMCVGSRCMSLIPNEDADKTLQEGVKLFSDDDKFGEYIEGFGDFIAEIQSFFDETLELKEISKEVWERFMMLGRRIFYFSSRTEFNYLDQAYVESEDKPKIRANLDEMYKMKERNREDVMNAFFLGQDCHFHTILKNLGKQFGLDWETLLEYTLDEIMALFDGRRVGEGILRERRQAIVAIGQSGKVEYLIGDTAARRANELRQSLGELDETVVTRHGIAANPGHAKGRVKIILSDINTFDKKAAEFSRMKLGDILVAETTSPDLMPACKMAGAILTDQGGLLSHAAVVARELGIPCIVGLNNLTEILNDGDMVEVDADRGVVRIIRG